LLPQSSNLDLEVSEMLAVRARPLDQLNLEATVAKITNRHPAVGLAVGVVRDGRLEFFSAHGLANIASNTPISEDTVFRIASITKTFTGVAVMQLWEQGLIDLDAPANNYLRAYKLVPAKASFRPPTVRHLLTHIAGIPQMVLPTRALTTVFKGSWLYGWGESFELGKAPSLAHYYGGTIRVVAEPGTRFTYGDHGFATLGQIVEDVAGMPLDRYFRECIFEPLGMADTDLNRSERVRSRLATGYNLRSNGPTPVTDRDWVTVGASNIYSTPRDMARYLAALLGGGANDHGRMLEPATMATMFEPHYQTDPRVPGMGLAFWRADFGGHLAVDAPGIIPGFDSQLWVAPDDGVALMAFTNGIQGGMIWMLPEIGSMLKQLLGVPDEVIRTDAPHHPELWADLCGWYPVSAQMTDMQARAIGGLGAEVFVRKGQLMIRAVSPIPVVYRGFPLHPDDDKDPYVFRIDLSRFGLGTMKVVFSQDARGTTTCVQTDFLPIALQKRPRTSKTRWVAGALGTLAAVSAIAARRRRRATGG
jgi:CubicO group peptidase (beta-lactamase class C family)